MLSSKKLSLIIQGILFYSLLQTVSSFMGMNSAYLPRYFWEFFSDFVIHFISMILIMISMRKSNPTLSLISFFLWGLYLLSRIPRLMTHNPVESLAIVLPLLVLDGLAIVLTFRDLRRS